MTRVTIILENQSSSESRFRAVADGLESEGRTAGQALDALTQQLGGSGEGMMVLVRPTGPDQFFTAAQQEELESLMQAWRAARDAGGQLDAQQQSRLETLVDEELAGAGKRAEYAAKHGRS